MRVETDWFDYETDDHDAEIAQNLKATAEATRDLASAVFGESRQQCHNCGKTRPCRPVAVKDENSGQVMKAPTCARCQTQYVEARIERARAEAEAQQAAKDLTDEDTSYNSNVDTPEDADE